MLIAQTLPNEEARLAELGHLNILDSAPDAFFESIVEMACALFEVPIAAISLVDRNRQWFLAERGLGIRETSRRVAFCDHTVSKGDVLAVPDATRDARFSHNPLVIDAPDIRFYAGAPLWTQNGYALGALCLIAPEPRKPPENINHLRTLADSVVLEIERRKPKKPA